MELYGIAGLLLVVEMASVYEYSKLYMYNKFGNDITQYVAVIKAISHSQTINPAFSI